MVESFIICEVVNLKQQLVHKHYFAQSNRLELLENFKGKEGFFVKAFFISDKINGNDWRVTWDAIKQDISDVVGLPIVLLTDLEHPRASVQDFFARGYIIDYELCEVEHKVTIIARIFDEKLKKALESGDLEFVSPAVVPRDSLSLEKIDGIDVLHRFIPLHLAIVARPAYGKVVAKMFGLCKGTGDFCLDYLKPLQASLQFDKPKITAISEWVAANYKTEFLQAFIAQKYKSDKMDDCVSREIKILMDNPDDKGKSREQIIAIALSKCRERNKASIAELLNPTSTDQKVGPLTQIPLLKLKQFNSSLDYMESMLDTLVYHGIPTFKGKEGYWIKARNQRVFVAEGQSVDEAIKSTCGCNKNR